MLGPLFQREWTIAPRRTKLYISRCVYTVSLLILTATAWLILSGSQMVEDLGDLARFGNVLFGILAPLQLVLAMFFSAIFAAGNVSQEKDRNTLVLLLLTRMNNVELVLGKLGASLLHLFVNVLAAVPVFFALLGFGGVDLTQIFRCFYITFAAVLLCGALGTTLAFWREQTFQAVSMTVLCLVVWLAGCEFMPSELAEVFSPWRAILGVTQYSAAAPMFPIFALLTTFALMAWTILRVRVWNRGENAKQGEDASEKKSEKARSVRKPRPIWSNPILWREIRTHAYGRRAFLVRLAYVVIFVTMAAVAHTAFRGMEISAYTETPAALGFAMKLLLPLGLLSLVLVNAQAVTSITGERDAHAIDLLLVSDLTPREIVFGKLGGIFWNTKEMVLLPQLFIGYLYAQHVVTGEIAFYLIGGLTVLFVFAAMLGIHSGMTYAGSRGAIGVSLGTLFFLFVGVAVCLRMMLALGGSFHAQLQPFLAFMAGGGVAMYLALGSRNPSSAIGLASFGCPFATFYAMSALMMHYTLGVFLVIVVTYGFTS